MKVNVIIELGADGTYGAYMDNNSLSFGLLGDGHTAREAKEDFLNSAAEMKAYYNEVGKEFPEIAFDFKFDLPSFLQYYAYAFSLAGLERITGVNQKQLSHYINGTRRPSEKTTHKIELKINSFAKEISQINFV